MSRCLREFAVACCPSITWSPPRSPAPPSGPTATRSSSRSPRARPHPRPCHRRRLLPALRMSPSSRRNPGQCLNRRHRRASPPPARAPADIAQDRRRTPQRPHRERQLHHHRRKIESPRMGRNSEYLRAVGPGLKIHPRNSEKIKYANPMLHPRHIPYRNPLHWPWKHGPHNNTLQKCRKINISPAQKSAQPNPLAQHPDTENQPNKSPKRDKPPQQEPVNGQQNEPRKEPDLRPPSRR